MAALKEEKDAQATGTLFVVATPIGNLEDITLRALRVLKEADLLAAEDTRHTRKLLTRYGIKTPLTSFHEHNERQKSPVLVQKLLSGKTLALVTDAGTPGVSDPGYRLVRLALETEGGIKVRTVPGPSALTAALSIAGLPTDSFTFKGFLPSSLGARRKSLEALADAATAETTGAGVTYVFFEAPGRLKKTLVDIKEVFGDEGEAEVVVARELTKLNEELLRGSPTEVLERLSPGKVKGEITLIVRVKKKEPSFEEALVELKELLDEGLSTSEAARRVARGTGIKKGLLYAEALKFKEGAS